MAEYTKTIDGIVSIKPVLDWAYQLITKGLIAGPVELVVRRPLEIRSLPANNKQWAVLGDIAKQLEWYGTKMDSEDWKVLLSNEYSPQRIIPAISGGFCVLNFRTSKASKAEMSDLIEIYYAFGSSKGVQWSEPALKEYESYSKAQ